jgi:CheY-like chemotaxis protein
MLFVDDSQVTRAVMGQLLRFHGHEVFTAAGVEEAKSLLTGGNLDMVITDFNMPGEDGLALARWVRAHASIRTLPILLVTADFDPDHTQIAREAGVDHFIEKTFSPEEMADAIEAAGARLARERTKREDPKS